MEEVLELVKAKRTVSPFSLLERWMEWLGSPLRCSWIKVKGMPLQAWHEGVFRLVGNCLGRTVEVDKKTVQKDYLKESRIRVQVDKPVTLPTQLSIWVEDLKFSVSVERWRRKKGSSRKIGILPA